MSNDFSVILNWLGATIGIIVCALAFMSLSLILLAYEATAWMAIAFQYGVLALFVIFSIAAQVMRRCTFRYYQQILGTKPNKDARSWAAWENLETTYHALTVTALLSIAALITYILTNRAGALVGSVITNLVMILAVMVFLWIFKTSLDE